MLISSGVAALLLLQASAFGSLGGLPLLVVFMVGMYFLLVLPNQRKQKKWQEMLGKLKAGDVVTTNSGLKGKIVSLRDEVLVLKLEPDGVRLEFVKSAIAAVTPAGEA